MKKLLFSFFCFSSGFVLLAQTKSSVDSSWKKVYRETAPRINDLVNTKLDARFDFSKAYMNGKVWITLKPHFYATDSLTLDAKGMDIHKVAIVKGSSLKELRYSYDNWQLKINLDRLYNSGEQYIVYIEYTSKPDDLKKLTDEEKTLHSIEDLGGLQFINPRGEEKNKPTQIWTQGETEQNSIWLPTIDKPNQKSTAEIFMTVPDKFVTLSNGKLVTQKKNSDGTRTDYWKMELPHAPYLFFMGAGEFAVVKDFYKNKEVNYYVAKEYASVARKIFGLTPEMISFFSKITGVDFPWAKYAQIAGFAHDGAMENTSATIFPADVIQQDLRELTDGIRWESVIAHELFHQWFGDYVTTESWSNITLNESFASFGEIMWYEFKYGQDAGDAQRYSQLSSYFRDSSNADKDLVRFYYAFEEDAFDAVGYEKGSCILNMLRHLVGDSAFFRSLNLYLTTNKFKSAEAQDLRLAFEEVTGWDLNWFWNQWYYGSGHPKLDINYSYDEAYKKVQVIVNQTQAGDKVFKLPVAVDIYNGTTKTRYQIWIKNKADTFYLNSAKKPDLINFDGDKILVAEKKENKTLDEYIYQYKYAGNYVDRREVIDFAAKNQTDPRLLELLKLALKDRSEDLRNYTLTKLDLKKDSVKSAVEPKLVELAKNDVKRSVKANAINKLAVYRNPSFSPIFKAAIDDSSYTVSGNALFALAGIDSVDALKEAKRLSAQTSKGRLLLAIMAVAARYGDESVADMILGNFERTDKMFEKLNLVTILGNYLVKVKKMEIVKRGIDDIVSFRDTFPFKGRIPFINSVLLKILKAKETETGLKEQADYIQSKLPAEDKK